MDAEILADSVEYELLTKAVYQAILRNEGEHNIEVKHNTSIKGRSGVEHQVDVSWKFKKAGVEHHVLIECKNYATSLTLEKVRNFFAVQHDVGNCQAVMVTKTGYQSGVVDFAKFYGISLKLLRKPTKDDWEGRIRDIQVNIKTLVLASNPEKAPRVTLEFPDDSPQPIQDAISKGELMFPADIKFVDANGIPISQGFRSWLPKALAGSGNFEGGPYTKRIPLDNHYIQATDKEGSAHILKIAGLTVTYYYDAIDMQVIRLFGDKIVEAILKDFSSGEIEHVKRKD